MEPTVHSFYNDKISSQLVEAQAKVFAHFNIPLKQWHINGITHCKWIEDIYDDHSDGEIAVIADIDAFPLSRGAYEDLVATAQSGSIVGLAQVANHKQPDHVYAGPMFLALKRQTYQDLGAPSLSRSDTTDVAQALTLLAQEKGINVEFLYPDFAIQSRWPLAEHGIFGVGTFYGNKSFFHLFESRKNASLQLFCAVAEGTVNGHHDFAKYLKIMEAPKQKKRLLPKLFR